MSAALDPKRILTIHVTRIGDTLMTTPALMAIAAAWPQAELTFLGHPKRAEVIENLPGVARVGTITKQRAAFRGWLPQRKWDLAFVFGNDAALVRYALRVSRKVVAFRQGDAALNARLFVACAADTDPDSHWVDKLLRLPRALGIPIPSRALAYRVTADEAAWAERLLAVAGGGQPCIGLVVESFPTKPYRDWPVSHFAELGRSLLATHPRARILLLGGPLPDEKIAALRAALGDALAVFAGQLSLRQTAAVMARLDLYVGVDTGPTHLAGALKLPMVALYHCLHPSRCYAPPEHAGLVALDHPALDRADCSRHSALADISVERVRAAAGTLLATPIAGNASQRIVAENA
jgi:heptosyltransferase-3